MSEELKNEKARRRYLAIRLLESGMKQTKVAEVMGVSQGSISHWKKAFAEKGISGLNALPQSGRKPRLSKVQKSKLVTYLDSGAHSNGFEGDFWTQKRVSRLIKEKFDVELKPRQCGNLLKELNYVWKVPQTKSYDQKADEVRYWKVETLPDIKKKPKPETR